VIPAPRSEPLPLPAQLSVSGSSHIGRIRRRNEDSIALRPDLGIAIVADGMGGHPGGDVASRIATDTAAELLSDALQQNSTGGIFSARMLPVVENLVRTAHERIRARGAAEPELDGMGTTLTAMVVDPDTASWVIGHVGDSRAYLVRDGRLEQLTRDDTWVQQQIDLGTMLPTAAQKSPYAHLLTQCLGLEEPPEPQVMSGLGSPGDIYLLCTDGLVGMLDDEAMSALLAEHAVGDASPLDPGAGEAMIEALLAAANEAGGHDNITAALVRIG